MPPKRKAMKGPKLERTPKRTSRRLRGESPTEEEEEEEGGAGAGEEQLQTIEEATGSLNISMEQPENKQPENKNKAAAPDSDVEMAEAYETADEEAVPATVAAEEEKDGEEEEKEENQQAKEEQNQGTNESNSNNEVSGWEPWMDMSPAEYQQQIALYQSFQRQQIMRDVHAVEQATAASTGKKEQQRKPVSRSKSDTQAAGSSKQKVSSTLPIQPQIAPSMSAPSLLDRTSLLDRASIYERTRLGRAPPLPRPGQPLQPAHTPRTLVPLTRPPKPPTTARPSLLSNLSTGPVPSPMPITPLPSSTPLPRPNLSSLFERLQSHPATLQPPTHEQSARHDPTMRLDKKTGEYHCYVPLVYSSKNPNTAPLNTTDPFFNVFPGASMPQLNANGVGYDLKEGGKRVVDYNLPRDWWMQYSQGGHVMFYDDDDDDDDEEDEDDDEDDEE